MQFKHTKNLSRKIAAVSLGLFTALSSLSGTVFAADSSKSAASDYSVFKAGYSAPLLSGDVKYPRLIDSSSTGYIAPFKDGDRVAFIGDSITHGNYGAYYEKQILNYYATRYPNVKFSYVNKGIDGDTAPGLISRADYDIFNTEFEAGFNKAVILIGTNDMSRTSYFEGKEKEPGAAKTRADLLNKYYTNLSQFVSMLKERGTEQIILMSPPLFDQWLKYETDSNGNAVSGPGYANKPTSVNFNNIIRTGGQIAYNVAQQLGVDFVDINTPQTIVEMYNRFGKGEREDETFTFVGDRVHPSEAGHYIMTYAFLKAQGESGQVAFVTMNTAEDRVDTENASVTNAKISSDKVSYTYKADALPMGADYAYRTAETYFPITEELNREVIKVIGLSEGTYDIKADGKLVMTATASQLADGVNIADKENNPGQQKALEILGIAEQRRKADAKHRDFIRTKRDCINKYKLDSTDSASLIKSAQAYIDANADKADDVKALSALITAQQVEKDTVAKLNAYESAIYELNKPSAYKVTIEKTSAAASDKIVPVLFDYTLPENTVEVKKSIQDRPITVTINGDELKSDVAPTIVDDRTLVPLRAIFEVFGAEFTWDEATATAEAVMKKGSKQTTIKLTENNKTTYVNGEANELDVPAQIIDGRFLVPVRFVAETLGANVEWDAWGQCVVITARSLLYKDSLEPVSAQQSGDDGAGSVIENSFDGDLGTRWAPQGKDGDAWGIYDLGDVYSLANVQIAYHNGKERTYFFAIAVSEDGENYTTVISDGKSSGTTNELETYDLGGVKARYVKYIGGGNSVNLWNSVTEIMFNEEK